MVDSDPTEDVEQKARQIIEDVSPNDIVYIREKEYRVTSIDSLRHVMYLEHTVTGNEKIVNAHDLQGWMKSEEFKFRVVKEDKE